ncbi:tetratricopeptide repeat protein [bacterium]|nr:MAG: tetratricopeptide repeat protein [bacterium]
MGAILVAFLAIGSSAATDPDPKRLDAIWDASYNRINSQLDVWFDDGDFPRAITLLKSQRELWPKDYEVATNLGWMQENIQMYGEALNTYQRYRLENPEDPDRALPEAQLYFSSAQFKRDPSGYDKAIALLEPNVGSPAHPNVYRILANAYERTKRFEDSARVWKIYLGKNPNDPAAKNNLARVEKKAAAEGEKSTTG